MIRHASHILENESWISLENFIDSEWISYKLPEDYGVDGDIIVCKQSKVTDLRISFQLKATEQKKICKSKTYPMEVKYLSFYKKQRIPILILLWIKPEDQFYYIFAQKYIDRILPIRNPNWLNQKTVSLKFDLLDGPGSFEKIISDCWNYLDIRIINEYDNSNKIKSIKQIANLLIEPIEDIEKFFNETKATFTRYGGADTQRNFQILESYLLHLERKWDIKGIRSKIGSGEQIRDINFEEIKNSINNQLVDKDKDFFCKRILQLYKEEIKN